MISCRLLPRSDVRIGTQIYVIRIRLLYLLYLRVVRTREDLGVLPIVGF